MDHAVYSIKTIQDEFALALKLCSDRDVAARAAAHLLGISAQAVRDALELLEAHAA